MITAEQLEELQNNLYVVMCVEKNICSGPLLGIRLAERIASILTRTKGAEFVTVPFVPATDLPILASDEISDDDTFEAPRGGTYL